MKNSEDKSLTISVQSKESIIDTNFTRLCWLHQNQNKCILQKTKEKMEGKFWT